MSEHREKVIHNSVRKKHLQRHDVPPTKILQCTACAFQNLVAPKPNPERTFSRAIVIDASIQAITCFKKDSDRLGAFDFLDKRSC